MKIISSVTKNDKKRVVVECAPDDQLIAVKPGAYYSLGQPSEFVVHGSSLQLMSRVTWCEFEQRWVV